MNFPAVSRGSGGASPLLAFLVLVLGISVATAGMNCGSTGISCPGLLGAVISVGTNANPGEYCCYRGGHNYFDSSVPYCCDFEGFVINTTGLTIGAIVGIAIGCLMAVLLFFVCCCWMCACCCFHRRRVLITKHVTTVVPPYQNISVS